MPDNISYTPEEVARILKISRFTVYELIKRGDLAAYRIGRKVRVEQADIDQYIQNTKSCVPNLTRSMVQVPDPGGDTQAGLIICGQDLILDTLSQHLEKLLPQLRFLRRHIGSMDGLSALYRGAANLVTAHLWDGDSGEYNLPYVRRMLPGHKTVVYNLVHRMEGFYVAKGNPKAIAAWPDLVRPGLRFVNRECGSGARVLLDEQLRRLQLEPARIAGYDQEETSHIAVASRVARGEADFGLGIEKAASQVTGVDFIPLHKERYDLIFRKEDLGLPHFQAVLEILRSKGYRDEVTGMGGYDLSMMGQKIAEV
jgi:putative molybdopterin biosynthesis protein